ncbi:MAG: hypothetical protein H0U13_13575, partial [Gemmatimonadaceae bacterium]|nr:hypothetical protein [Gemmatimonadaceae bacterium]
MMLTVFLIALALPCATPPACTCVPGPPPDSRAAVAAYAGGSAAVFEGQVVRVELAADSSAPADSSRGERWFRWMDLVATMVVTRQWKGELADTIRVRTALQTSMCGAELIEGHRYLVFAGAGGYSRGGADAPA